jgi:hypothetical protein
MTSPRRWIFHPLPETPASWDSDVAFAVRALYAGVANDGQQKLIWAWLMYVSGVDDWAYRPDSAGTHASAIVLGKQFVGHSFKKMLSDEVTAVINQERAAAVRNEQGSAVPATSSSRRV